jgi:hypothetical protein
MCKENREVCEKCGKPFNDNEWKERHDSGLYVYHPECCPECNGLPDDGMIDDNEIEQYE